MKIDDKQAGVMPTENLTDVFTFFPSTPIEHAVKKQKAEKEAAGEEYEEPEGLKEKLAGIEAISNGLTAFRNNINACQMSATSVMKQPEVLDKK